MLINLGLEVSYYTPEGEYRIEIEQVGPPNRPARLDCDDQVRLSWGIIYPISNEFDYKLGKNYCADLRKGSPLWMDLESFLGPNFIYEIKIGERQAELERLLKRQADAIVCQKSNGGYKQPYSYIKALYPPGTLIHLPTDSAAA